MNHYVGLALWLAVPVAAVWSAEPPPNIVIVLADDLAMGDLGCYGQTKIRTPRLDRMAAEGTRFTQHYSGTSVCAPSRASLITGLHSGHCPIRANREVQPEGQMPLPAGTVTIARILKDAGYATACAGKWGMGMFDTPGSPLKSGFDRFFGYNCQRHAHSYFSACFYRDDQRFDLPGNDGKKARATYAQNLVQSFVLEWIRSVRDRPFFLFYAATLPHGRFEIADLGAYADLPWNPLQKTYAAMVTRLDSDVGQVLDLVVELGIAPRTLVIFMADNGSAFAPDSEVGSFFDQSMGGPLRGYKRSLYEGGLRNPCVAWWPGIVPAGRVVEEPWAFWDFLPTVVELAGASMPAGFQPDGLSVAGMLRGGPAPRRDYFYWELHERASLQAWPLNDASARRTPPPQKMTVSRRSRSLRLFPQPHSRCGCTASPLAATKKFHPGAENFPAGLFRILRAGLASRRPAMKPVLSDQEMEDGRRLWLRLLAMGLDPRGPDGMPDGWARATLARRRAWAQWAIAYRRMGGRQAMLRHGYLFPPVQPAGDVDAEWRQFERWMAGSTRRNAVRRQARPRRIPFEWRHGGPYAAAMATVAPDR